MVVLVKSMIFRVEGKPQGKARARTFYNKRIGKMQSITPEQTKSYEELIRWNYKISGGEYFEDKAITLSILAVYEIPKNWSEKKTKTSIKRRYFAYCKGRFR